MSDTLHPLERRVLRTLAQFGSLSFKRLVEDSRMDEDQVRRSLQWLSSKGLVEITEERMTRLSVAEDPPELLLLDAVMKAPSEGVSLDELRRMFAPPDQFSAAFGRAKRAGWVAPSDSSQRMIVLRDPSTSVSLQSLLTKIKDGADETELTTDQVAYLPDLERRSLVRREENVETTVTITGGGREASSGDVESDLIDRLTPDMLATQSWKGKRMRPIDVETKAPTFFPGRRHPVRDFIREVRETYISMGFTELQGDSVNPAFWNFDALFIPQDHPGREMQDTFYIEGLVDRKLARKGVVANVASTHEGGWKTGSKGWGYTWKIEEARRLVLRTHNTVLTVKALSESKEKETRVFAVSKVYRNENLDYKHLAEFYQMDGIMVGEGLSVRNLMGFLTEFYKKLGMKEVRLWPTYFPYTEPSLEVVGYSEAVKGWIELSGSGVFRPEVTVPLGVKVPVLAWGPGIERLMLMRFGLDDMRDLYGGDLSWLRSRVDLASS